MPKFDIQSAVQEAVTIALTEQALRVGSILQSSEAEGRRDLAMTMALHSTLSAESAIALLRSAPREHSSADRFLQAMAREGEIGVDSSGAQPSLDKRAARMLEIAGAAKHVRAQRYGVK